MAFSAIKRFFSAGQTGHGCAISPDLLIKYPIPAAEKTKVAWQDDSDHSAVRFDYGAVREIFRYPNGTPRMINAISDKALPAGYVYRTTTIDRGIVQVALNELKEVG